MIHARFTLYYSDNRQISNSTFDCIYGYLDDNLRHAAEPMIYNYHLIPYCRRPDKDEIQEEIGSLDRNYNRIISFDELKKQGVTSTMLLTWMAPIDVAERYEKYDGSSDDVFYNCSSPWFGTMCQYKFDYDTTGFLFGDIVNATFESRVDLCLSMKMNTCYPFLRNCSLGSSSICLDWREICDGKFDCIDGEDEQFCEQLELNECGNDEYRCHYGGQCIPLMFLDDGRTNVDCLDGTDEIDPTLSYETISTRLDCNGIPTFLCEERTCRYPHSFSCGDGQCILFDMINWFNSECFSGRHLGISRVLLTSDDDVSNIACQQVLRCLIRISYNMSNSCSWSISNNLNVNSCESLVTHCPSEWVAIPKQPNLFGFFQFIYLTNRSNLEFENNVLPNFVCFNPQRCPGLLRMIVPIELNNSLTCCRISDIINGTHIPNFNWMELSFKNIIKRCLTIGTELSCSHSSLFHCSQSLKCISYHRLVDGFHDCYFGEDESYPTCQLNDSSRFKCLSHSNRCLAIVALGNMGSDCPRAEDELVSIARVRLQGPPFPYLCNNVREELSIIIEQNDEKYCEEWPCNTPYVRCDVKWDCYNGLDELNCPNVDVDCLPNEHYCQRNDQSNFRCLPIEHLFEQYLNNCPQNSSVIDRQIFFDNRTNSNMSEYISWNKTNCITEDMICGRHSLLSHSDDEICLYQRILWPITPTIHVLSANSEAKCRTRRPGYSIRATPFLSRSHLGFFPPASVVDCLGHNSTVNISIPVINISRSWYCNRGILVEFRSNKTLLPSTTMPKCLCPPSYFGARCQWQNQRVSLTLRLSFRSSTLANIAFQVIIMLIDEYGQILPNHEQITFVPIRDCNKKFNIYLLYPDRPKHVSANYSIRIDIFHKITLDYYASWHLSIPFQFLPVNRLAAQLFIPESHQTESCPLLCGNYGKCRKYANKELLYFCQCDEGYSGRFCNITEICHCSNDSFCLSSSICVCSLYTFGSQCYLKDETCQLSNNPCKHNGLCIPNDDRISRQTFTCLCPEDYSGVTCEISNSRIYIQLDETITKIFPFVFVHFIAIFDDKDHERTTTFKKIPYDQNTITLYVQQQFNILFVELTNKTYYLTVVREIFTRSENITTQVQSNQRCHSINELLNSTFLDYDQFRRIKYYPMVCRQHKQLMCFYDESHLCVCDLDRFSNCFEFNHTVKYDCQQQNICENDGRCFENNATCPTKTMCLCEDCYYGYTCQFSTNGFILSLDPILGYHIKPNIPINRQPAIVKLSIAIITCLFLFGLISESLSIMTFTRKPTRVVGCGWYLLASSTISLFLLIILKIKFWILVLSQQAILTNQSFLLFSCIITDATLKTLLATNDWLNACVAIERTFTILNGVNFNQNKSKQIAKRLIFIVIVLTICTYLHDPLYRKLIDDFDTDEKRTWCFVRYSSSVDMYNFSINLFHFVTPVLINFIAAIIIIVAAARSRSNSQTNVLFIQHLKEQLRHHKHLLWAPCLIVFLSLPRLIIPFFSGCMKSPRDPWLFLISYFISFIPVILHFFIFVRPSKKYMEEFRTAIQRIIRRFHRKFMSH